MSKPILLPNEERRAVSLELRASGSAAAPVIRGHAALFNSLSSPITAEAGGKKITFREQIAPGAFSEALTKSDVRALFNHEPDNILGRTAAKTLRMQEDETGLAIEIDPPDTTCGRDLQVSMKRGDVNQMSFGFTVAQGGDKWEKDPENAGWYIRTISKIAQLYDVSPVTYPAYPETECSLRSLVASEQVEIPKVDTIVRDYQRRQLDLESVLCGPEVRVNMGWAGYNTLGSCNKANQEDCLCSGCDNMAFSNMQAGALGACTMCMRPACLCLGCPNTDDCTLLKMYQMY